MHSKTKFTHPQAITVLKRYAKKVKRFHESSDAPDGEVRIGFYIDGNMGSADDFWNAMRSLRRTDMNRHKDLKDVVVYQLGSLTVSIARSSCHACGRDNQGLTFASKRVGCRGNPITICSLCVVEVLAYHREHEATARRKR